MKKKHQDAHQLIELYKYTKSNETNGEYIFQIRENEFKKKLEEEEEEKRNKMIEELRKKKSIYKPIQREELDEFKRKHEEVRQELLLKKYQERVNHFQEHEQKNLNSQIPETESYKKILVEEKLNKENNDKHKLDKIYKAMKIKNFAKAINDNIKPHVNEDKRVELELRIDKLKNSKKYIPHHHKRKPRILLKK